jgi:hypothetical protein
VVEKSSNAPTAREGYALPHSQAGYFHNCELRLLPESSDEHNGSADQHQPAKQRRNINVRVFIRSGVDRSDVEELVFMCIVESAIGEGKTTQYDEENAHPNERFHGDCAGG